jgi:hypothetical protein
MIRSRLSLALVCLYGAVLVLLAVRATQHGLGVSDYVLAAVAIYWVADGLFRKAPLGPGLRRSFVIAAIAGAVLVVLMILKVAGVF